MTDDIRKKHEAQRDGNTALCVRTGVRSDYLSDSQSDLTVADVDALFAALDDARGDVDAARQE